MRGVNDSLSTLIQEKFSLCTSINTMGELHVDIKTFNALPEFVQSEICVKLLEHFHLEPAEEKIERLLRLSQLPVGKTIELGSHIAALHERDGILITIAQQHIDQDQEVRFGTTLHLLTGTFSISKPLPVPDVFSGNRNVEFVDAERLNQHLVLRTWHNGDWFIPFGLHAKKKLSDYFANEKIPRHRKSAIPILESNGSIVWVCGKRLDDRFKLTSASRTAVKLTYHPIL
jgi:tRNA(Ile)-lysidine synthase